MTIYCFEKTTKYKTRVGSKGKEYSITIHHIITSRSLASLQHYETIKININKLSMLKLMFVFDSKNNKAYYCIKAIRK